MINLSDVEREEAEHDEHDTDEEENDVGEDGRAGEVESEGVDISIKNHHYPEKA